MQWRKTPAADGEKPQQPQRDSWNSDDAPSPASSKGEEPPIPMRDMKNAPQSATSDDSDASSEKKKKKKKKISPANGDQDENDPFAHLPEHYQAVLREQLDTPVMQPSIKELYRYASRNDTIIIVISTLCAIGAGAVLPLMTVVFGNLSGTFQGFFLGTVSESEFDSQLGRLTLYFVYLAIGEFFTSYVFTVGFIYSGEHIAGKIREQYLAAILRQNVGYFDKLGAGEITTRITADTNLIQDGISEKLGITIMSIATFVTAFIVAYVKYWLLALILTSAIVAICLIMAAFSKNIVTWNKAALNAYAAGGTVAEEVLGSIRNATAFATQNKLANQYDEHLAKAEFYGRKHKGWLGLMLGALMFCIYLNYALAFWQGSRFLVTGQGDVNLSTILTIMLSIMIGAFNLGNVAPNLQAFFTAIAASGKIYNTIDRVSPLNSTNDDGIVLDHVRGEIELVDVTHIYPSRPEVTVMHHVNLSAKAGKTTALVGASGSGKSTIIGLVERFYSPVEGQILLDGEDVSNLNLRFLRRQISLVSQEPTLFSTTIFGNIAHGLIGTKHEHASREEKQQLITEAAKMSNAHDFIMGLPEQYETNVGDRGFLLSGGQKQRVAIARAVVSDPKILLLDEATSALDTKSEKVVQEALDRAAEGRTTIVIAHRLSTIKNADNIIVMSEGKIVEQGTHAELLDKQGAYASLVEAQAIAQETQAQNDEEYAEDDEEEPEPQEELERSEPIARTHSRGSSISQRLSQSIRDFRGRSWSQNQRGRTAADRDWSPHLSRDKSYINREKSIRGSQRKNQRSRSRSEMTPRLSRDNLSPQLSRAPSGAFIKRQKTDKSLSAAALEEQATEPEVKYSLWTLIKVVASFNYRDWPYMLAGMFASVLAGGAQPVQSVFFAKCIVALALPPPLYAQLRHDIDYWCWMYFMLAWVVFIAFSVQGVAFAYCSERLVHKSRNDSFRRMLRQDISFFDRDENSAGALTTYLSTQTNNLAGLSGTTLGTILNVLTTLVAAFALSLAIGWKLALVCIATVPVLLACGFFRFWMLAKFQSRSKTAYEGSAAYACEATSAIRTVASLTREQDVWDEYHRKLANQGRESLKSVAASSILYAASQSFMFLCFAVGFYYGGTLIGKREYGLEQFFIVFSSVIFGAQSAGTVFSFAPDMGKAKGAATALKKLFDRQPPIDNWNAAGTPVPTTEGHLEFRNVHFRYPTRPGQPVLRGLNLQVRPGEYIALVGPSGCGKSTTIQLLERFYDPQAGAVLLDGQNVSGLQLQEYRKHIALVSQEPTLYQGTIRDNILLGADRPEEEVSEEAIEQACKDANIYNFILSLPDGFNTVVGNKGVMLSGGQKQRIAIARALLRNPRVLLLDEATSALDSESEKIVQAALDYAAKGRTTVAVAHRLSTIQKADRIYVFEAGAVVEAGTHTDLMNKRGRYFELVKGQSLEKAV